MRTVKIKTDCAGGARGWALAHPQAVAGPQDGSAVVYEVMGVPDDVTTGEALSAMMYAIVLVERDAPAADYVIAWDELRPGRFVRRGRYLLTANGRGQS